MLSYGVSMLVLIGLMLLGIRYLIKALFPSAHRGLAKTSKPLRQALMGLIKRLGWGRCILIAYLFFAAVYTLAIIPVFFRDFLKHVGALTVMYFPLIAIWKVRKYRGKRREGRYRLPGRRR